MAAWTGPPKASRAWRRAGARSRTSRCVSTSALQPASRAIRPASPAGRWTGEEGSAVASLSNRSAPPACSPSAGVTAVSPE